MSVQNSWVQLFMGNVILIALILILRHYLKFESIAFNLFGSSLLFAFLSFAMICWIKKGIRKSNKSSFFAFSAGAAILRFTVSLLWVLMIQKLFHPTGIAYVLDFIFIYLYYLIADIVLLGRLAKGRLQ